MWCINSLRPSDTYISISKLTIIGLDNGLSPGRHQAIIWSNAGILFIRPSRKGINFSEILIAIGTFSFKKMHLKMLSGKSWPQCVNTQFCFFLKVQWMTSHHWLRSQICVKFAWPHQSIAWSKIDIHVSSITLIFCLIQLLTYWWHTSDLGHKWLR